MSSPEPSKNQPDSSTYLRKIRKPLIERKRRERINRCLIELKDILLDNIKRNGGTQVSKLDKADILEMAVSHLRQIHHQHISVAMATSVSAVQQFQQGYSECINETLRFMEVSSQYPGSVISRIRNHLSTQHPGMSLPSISSYHHSAHPSSSTARNPETIDRLPETADLHTNISDRHPVIADLHTEIAEQETNISNTDISHTERKCRSASPVRQCMNTSHTLAAPKKRSLDDMYSDSHSTPVKRRRRELRFDSMPNMSNAERSQNAVLTIPLRLPVSINDSPPQRQVWRPF